MKKSIFEKYGVTWRDVQKAGLPCSTFWSHCSGLREISAEAALRYERLLGIPRWELRPDLWEPPKKQEEP